MIKKRKKFLRRNSDKYSRLGWGRRKLQKWRRPRGRHSKMRERRKGYPTRPNIGLKKPANVKPILVTNMRELETAKGEIIFARVGKKLREEMQKKAHELKLKVLNNKK